MKILSVGGTRPQILEMAVLAKAFNEYNLHHTMQVEHRLLYTGQCDDPMMPGRFFEELDLPDPDLLLGMHPGSPGMETAAMLASLEVALLQGRPDAVLIYGDSNGTLAGALATVKLHIPLVRLDAGLRSFNRRMPEEMNRIVCDHVSDLLLSPTQSALVQLQREGLGCRASFAGDVLLDAVAQFSDLERQSPSLRQHGLERREYALVSLHRGESAEDIKRFRCVMHVFERLRLPVALLVLPRLKQLLGEEGLRLLNGHSHIRLIEGVGYLEMLILEQRASMILTDSGFMQRVAYFLGVPCLTMREETEWVETLHGGWNELVGCEPLRIFTAVERLLHFARGRCQEPRNLSVFGEGHAGAGSAEQIIDFVRTAA
ncbi:MAG TPA: UDP-N-acetylglucosamine 2-epimerase (non-hydrolyzing) [Granulicella sp.]|jgi:UDP-GlcNAc3NAcA epimerase|nr:UDP-N-acetylglucosamine 2-epimerase (non-hydrolyzing) [Granulicella sp.]